MERAALKVTMEVDRNQYMFFLASSKHHAIECISHILVVIILCKQSLF